MDTTNGEGLGQLRPTDSSNYRGTGRTSCPECGYSTDAVGSATGEAIGEPEDGSLTICFRCAAVAVYVDGPFGLTLREATAAEVAECDKHNPGVRAFNQANPR